MKGMRCRGNTLLEVMVCASLLALTLGMMAPLFGRTSRVVNRADKDAASQQQALVGVQKLFAEAAYSSPASLRINPSDPTACSFLSQQPLRDVNAPPMGLGDYLQTGLSTPDMRWRKMLVVYWQSDSKQLNYKEFTYTDPQQEIALVQRDRLQALIYRTDSPIYTVASGVTTFTVESPQQGLISASITAEKEWDKNFKCKLELLFAMRNQ